jgi:hypothetical protein
MDNFHCEICNKIFKTLYTLDTHKKTSKKCLKKQGLTVETFKCEYCDKILTTNARLNTHLNICKIKVKKEKENDKKHQEQLKEYKENFEEQLKKKDEIIKLNIKEKNDLILQLKEREKQKDEYILKIELLLEKANKTIAEIAIQPKTTNNTDNRVHNQNYITNNFDINDIEKITDVLENHLTTDVLRRGQEGVADMLKTHLLQTETGDLVYECTDVSRQKFEFRNVDGNIETDPKATKLIRNLGRSGMWNKAHSTGKKLWEDEDGLVNYEAQDVFMSNVIEVLEIDKDSSKLRSRLASITARQKPNKI